MARDFGDYNPRFLDERYRKVSSETTGIRGVRDGAIQSNSSIKDALKSKGPYMGEVLKIFDSPADKSALKAASGFNLWGSVESKPDDIVTIVVRIPVLDHLPLPESLPLNPDADTYAHDAKVVDMYTRYVTDKPGLPMPEVGQKVWVDFEDDTSYYGGVYLGIVDSNEAVSSRSVRKISSPKKAIEKKPDKEEKEEREEKEISKKLDSLTPEERAELASTLTTIKYDDAEIYKENRVRLFSFKELKRNSDLLVVVPEKYRLIPNAKVRVHKLVLPRFIAMNEAWIKAPESGGEYFKFNKPGTGWRLHLYKKDYVYYKKEMFKQYRHHADFAGLKSQHESQPDSDKPGGAWFEAVALKATGYIAFASPHCTGLAIDLAHYNHVETKGNGIEIYDGIFPNTTPKKKGKGVGIRKNKQKKSKQHLWLMANAYKFGFTPYVFEPWHWELLPPRTNYFLAEEFALDSRGYVIRVVERSIKEYPENLKTPMKAFSNKGKHLLTTELQFAWVPFDGPPKNFIVK